jgi:hypothetical protein
VIVRSQFIGFRADLRLGFFVALESPLRVDAVEKGFWGGLLATLIQDQEQMRNHDSRNHLPGFVRFNF